VMWQVAPAARVLVVGMLEVEQSLEDSAKV
jgi:hypothetical protein